MDDMELFHRALENLPDDLVRAKFGDAVPESAPVQPRRRRGGGSPPFDLTLDLHGCTRDEALVRLKREVSDAPGKRVLIITGRGRHSESGRSVIRDLVASFLEEHAGSTVRDFGYAPPEHGGRGAFVVHMAR